MTRQDVRDGALWAQRSKTGEKVRIEVAGPLQRVLARLTQGSGVGSVYLLHDRHGQPYTLQCLRRRFEVIRKKLGANWQIRDLRAKAATDSASTEDANRLLAHASMSTTDVYIRKHAGRSATPVMREIADTTPGLRTPDEK